MSTTLLSQTAFTTTHLIRLPPRPAPTPEANAASPPSSNRPGRPRLGVAKDYHVRDVDSAGTAARLAEDLRAALLRLRHPNLVTMRQISTHRPADAARSDAASAGAGRFSVRVVSDFVDDAGDLHNLLHTRYRSRRFLSEAHIFCIFAQICLALKYLHDNYICHGMLHPRNVLLQGSSYRKEDGQPPLTVKLTDFGCGHLAEDDPQSPHPRAAYRRGFSTAVAATRRQQQQPELPLTLKSDMWSLGALLFEMTALTVPVSELSRGGGGAEGRGRLPAMPAGAPCGPSTANLLSRLLDPNPETRPDINMVLMLPVVQHHVQALMARVARTPPEMLSGSPDPQLRRISVVQRRPSDAQLQAQSKAQTQAEAADRERQRMQARRVQELEREAQIGESRRQRREAQRQAEQAAQLERLKQARIDAHSERNALGLKFRHKKGAVEERRQRDRDHTVAFAAQTPQVLHSSRPEPAPPLPSAYSSDASRLNRDAMPLPVPEQVGGAAAEDQDEDRAHFFSPPATAVRTGRRRSSSGRRSEEDERKHLNALKQARIEAHNERLALQRRMSGMGGRPTNPAAVVSEAAGTKMGFARASAHVALTPETRPYAHSSRAPNSSGGHGVPSSSPARRRNSTDVAVAKEAAHLERLRLARIEARDERLALQRKMGAVGGRPVRRLPGSHGGEAEEILSPHLRGGGGGRPGLGRDNVVENARRKKEDANRAHLERLKQARIDAHQERMALQLRMKGMAGRPGGGARPGGSGDHGAGQGDLLRQQAVERSSGVEQAVVKNDDSEYLEQLRLARVEAFEKRKALALRHEGARGERGGSGAGLVPGRRQAQDQGQQQTKLPLRSGSTSEQVLRAKSQRKAEEQARHERMLLEARKAAFAERQALEAKMRNGGTTPGR